MVQCIVLLTGARSSRDTTPHLSHVLFEVNLLSRLPGSCLSIASHSCFLRWGLSLSMYTPTISCIMEWFRKRHVEKSTARTIASPLSSPIMPLLHERSLSDLVPELTPISMQCDSNALHSQSDISLSCRDRHCCLLGSSFHGRYESRDGTYSTAS